MQVLKLTLSFLNRANAPAICDHPPRRISSGALFRSAVRRSSILDLMDPRCQKIISANWKTLFYVIAGACRVDDAFLAHVYFARFCITPVPRDVTNRVPMHGRATPNATYCFDTTQCFEHCPYVADKMYPGNVEIKEVFEGMFPGANQHEDSSNCTPPMSQYPRSEILVMQLLIAPLYNVTRTFNVFREFCRRFWRILTPILLSNLIRAACRANNIRALDFLLKLIKHATDAGVYKPCWANVIFHDEIMCKYIWNDASSFSIEIARKLAEISDVPDVLPSGARDASVYRFLGKHMDPYVLAHNIGFNGDLRAFNELRARITADIRMATTCCAGAIYGCHPTIINALAPYVDLAKIAESGTFDMFARTPASTLRAVSRCISLWLSREKPFEAVACVLNGYLSSPQCTQTGWDILARDVPAFQPSPSSICTEASVHILARARAPIEFTEKTIEEIISHASKRAIRVLIAYARARVFAISPDVICNACADLARFGWYSKVLYVIRQFIAANLITPSECVLEIWFSNRHSNNATLNAYADYVAAHKGKQCVIDALQRALPRMCAKGLYNRIIPLCERYNIPIPRAECATAKSTTAAHRSLLQLGYASKQAACGIIRTLNIKSKEDLEAAVQYFARRSIPIHGLKRLIKLYPRTITETSLYVYPSYLLIDIVSAAIARKHRMR